MLEEVYLCCLSFSSFLSFLFSASRAVIFAWSSLKLLHFFSRFDRALTLFFIYLYSWRGKTLRIFENSLKSHWSSWIAKRPNLVSPGSKTNSVGSRDCTSSLESTAPYLKSSPGCEKNVSLRISGFPIKRIYCGSCCSINFLDSKTNAYFRLLSPMALFRLVLFYFVVWTFDVIEESTTGYSPVYIAFFSILMFGFYSEKFMWVILLVKLLQLWVYVHRDFFCSILVRNCVAQIESKTNWSVYLTYSFYLLTQTN